MHAEADGADEGLEECETALIRNPRRLA